MIPVAVKDFVTGALAGLFGVQVTTETTGFGIVTGNLPPPLGDLLPSGQLVKVSFEIAHSPRAITTLAVITASSSNSARW